MDTYAGAKKRFGAYCIDLAVTILLQVPLWVWYVRGLSGPESGLFLLGYTVLLPAVWVLMRALYHVISWSWRHKTLGMHMLWIEVAPLAGRRLTVWRCLLRYLGMILCTYTAGIGYLMMFWNDSRQGLHDWISSTIIVTTQDQ